MTSRIPPLNPLRVFEVVARTQNLTTAATELHVTQSAVSRQIGVLETYLGVELFRRERHGVTLTRIGRSYADEIIPAFSDIASATERLIKGSSEGALRVRTYTTFAAKWLIPRLTKFRVFHPNIEVRIMDAVAEVDFDRDSVDIAIQFGVGKWPHVQTDLLFYDEFEPVCAPCYLMENTENGKRLELLLRQRLLISHYRRADWDDWLSATNMAAYAVGAERMTFSSSVLTWQAAINGLGTAIGQSALLVEELESGQLVRPFAMPLHRDKAYYLVRPKVQRELRKVAVFRDWLLNEVRENQAS